MAAPSSPLTQDDLPALLKLLDAIVGQRLEAVRYLVSDLSQWSDADANGRVHVAETVFLGLSSGLTVRVRWSAPLRLEGLEFFIDPPPSGEWTGQVVDAAGQREWSLRIGMRVVGLRVAWQEASLPGFPMVLWSVTLVFDQAMPVTFALGDLADGAVYYTPDAVAVMFDQTLAEGYRPRAALSSAWGEDLPARQQD